VVTIGRFVSRSNGGKFLAGLTIASLVAGMLIMYLTTLLI